MCVYIYCLSSINQAPVNCSLRDQKQSPWLCQQRVGRSVQCALRHRPHGQDQLDHCPAFESCPTLLTYVISHTTTSLSLALVTAQCTEQILFSIFKTHVFVVLNFSRRKIYQRHSSEDAPPPTPHHPSEDRRQKGKFADECHGYFSRGAV